MTLSLATVTVGTEPCRPPTFSFPASKSVLMILSNRDDMVLAVSAKFLRARSSTAVRPGASEAVVRASSVDANAVKGPYHSVPLPVRFHQLSRSGRGLAVKDPEVKQKVGSKTIGAFD